MQRSEKLSITQKLELFYNKLARKVPITYDELNTLKSKTDDACIFNNYRLSRFGVSIFHLAVMHASDDIVLYMIEHGADVNLCDDNGTTAVHIAAVSGRANNLTVLLENGADADRSNNQAETPLTFAINGVCRQDDKHNYLLCAKILLSFGADPHLCSNYGTQSAYDAALINRDYFRDNKEHIKSENYNKLIDIITSFEVPQLSKKIRCLDERNRELSEEINLLKVQMKEIKSHFCDLPTLSKSKSSVKLF